MIETKGGWIYMLTNHKDGSLYTGVTNDLVRRVWEHRTGVGSMYARRYYIKRLVYCERHDDIEVAIRRETAIKKWPRARKIELIIERNPEWRDLYEDMI